MDTCVPPTRSKELCRRPPHRAASTSSKRETHAAKVSGLIDLKEPAVPFQAFVMAAPRAGSGLRLQRLAWGELF